MDYIEFIDTHDLGSLYRGYSAFHPFQDNRWYSWKKCLKKLGRRRSRYCYKRLTRFGMPNSLAITTGEDLA